MRTSIRSARARSTSFWPRSTAPRRTWSPRPPRRRATRSEDGHEPTGFLSHGAALPLPLQGERVEVRGSLQESFARESLHCLTSAPPPPPPPPPKPGGGERAQHPGTHPPQ